MAADSTFFKVEKDGKVFYKVSYLAGESRYSDAGIDYMHVIVPITDEDGWTDEVELYAEAEPIGHYDEDGEWVYDDEWGTEAELTAAILEQAQEKGVPAELLIF